MPTLQKQIMDCLLPPKEVSAFVFLPASKRGYKQVEILEVDNKVVKYFDKEKYILASLKYTRFLDPTKLRQFMALWRKWWEKGISFEMEGNK